MSSLKGRERAKETQHTLAYIEQLLWQDDAAKALEVLGRTDKPPAKLPTEQALMWYWLAGWALMLAGRLNDAVPLLERGLRLAEQRCAHSSPLQRASLAESTERLRCFLGLTLCALGKTQLAMQYHRRGLIAIADKTITDGHLKLMIYKGLGNESLILGWYQEAIGYYQKAIKQAENLDALRQQGLAYWGLGLSYQQSNDLPRAKTNYQHALRALGVWGNLPLLAQVRALLGQVLIDLGEYQEAGIQLTKSLENARLHGDNRSYGIALVNKAALHLARGDAEQAITVAISALQWVQQSQDRQTEGQLQLTLASAYIAAQDLPNAEQAFKRAIQIFEQINAPDMQSKAYQEYGNFLANEKRFKEAYQQMYLARTIINK